MEAMKEKVEVFHGECRCVREAALGERFCGRFKNLLKSNIKNVGVYEP